MRFIGDKDFYDGVMAHGFESNEVFYRRSQNIETNVLNRHIPIQLVQEIFQKIRYKYGDTKGIESIRFVAIYFCGKMYRYFIVRSFNAQKHTYYGSYGYTKDYTDTYVINDESLEEFVRTHYKWENEADVNRWKRHFAPLIEVSEVNDTFFVDHNVTMASFTMEGVQSWDADCYIRNYDKQKLCWNIDGHLGSYGFQKIMDAYTVAQEISMWVNGVLPGLGKPMIEVSNDVRIEKHGFDLKTSFRKGKGPKRKGR